MTHAEFFEASDIIALEHTTTAAPLALVRRTIAELYPNFSAEEADTVLDCWYWGLVHDEEAEDVAAIPEDDDEDWDWED